MKAGTKVLLGMGALGTAALGLLARRRRPRSRNPAVGDRLLVGDAGPPPRPVVGEREGDQEGLVVLRPGETRYLPLGGLATGQVVCVLPPGDYETCQRNAGQPGAGEAVLVDVDPREHEVVVTWMVVGGGRLELAAREVGERERELVCHVVATHPHTRFTRFG